MRNFSEATVTTSEVKSDSYETCLAWARTQQAKENKRLQDESHPTSKVSYTIEEKEGGEGKVFQHIGINGGNPPHQAIVHSK